MKTISRLICRHIAAALCIVLLVLFVNGALVLALLVRAGAQATRYPAGLHRLSASFARQSDGSVAPTQAEDWLKASGCAWVMLLGQQGEILWQHALPQQLNHRYTIGQIAAFTRWYLDDYPVFVSRNDFGLLVMGMPRGSFTRFDFYIGSGILQAFLRAFWPLLALDGALILACCLLLGFASAKSLRGVALGIDMLARGESVRLPERGMAGELAEKLNRTSRRLAEQSEAIARRDSTRTEWIAGVSHDIRTPLALILAHAEHLTASAEASAGLRQEAQAIIAQCGVIRALIEDLNLTSKLQYGAQPLRAQPVAAGALVRGCVSDFLNSIGGRSVAPSRSGCAAGRCGADEPRPAQPALQQRAPQPRRLHHPRIGCVGGWPRDPLRARQRRRLSPAHPVRAHRRAAHQPAYPRAACGRADRAGARRQHPLFQ